MKKTGFSLAEALVSMLILSIFFVVTSKVITTRQPDEWSGFAHGYYECYQNNEGGFHYRNVTANDLTEEDADTCQYSMPVRTVSQIQRYYIINSDIRVEQDNFPGNYEYSESNMLENFDALGETSNVECNNFINSMDRNSVLRASMGESCDYNGVAMYIKW